MMMNFCKLLCLSTLLIAVDLQANSTAISSESFKTITPSAGPRVQNGADVIMSIDFLYWTARQDGLAFARTGIINPNAALDGIIVTPGTTIAIPGRMDPGFKAGIGLNLPHDLWDTTLEYTWFQTTESRTQDITLSAEVALRPLWDAGGLQSSTASGDLDLLGYNVAYGKWRFRFNNFDLELGRSFYMSQHFKMRPHMGLKGCWYRQQYLVQYTDTSASDIPIVTIDSVKMEFNQNFWGFGVRSGVDNSWQFNKNWSLFDQVATSILWGRFEVTRQDYLLNDIDDSNDKNIYQVVKTDRDFHTIKPVLENTLGVRYDYWFCNERYHLGIAASWETQIWLNHNQLFKLQDDWGNHGDLVFQGFTLQTRFDF